MFYSKRRGEGGREGGKEGEREGGREGGEGGREGEREGGREGVSNAHTVHVLHQFICLGSGLIHLRDFLMIILTHY